MSRTNVIHGARVRFKVSGQVVGKMFNVSITRRFNHQPVDPLGTPFTEEHILVSYEVEGSGERYRSYGKSLRAVGLEPSNTDILDILQHPEFVAEVEDQETPGTIKRIEGFRISEIDENFAKGQLTMERFRFVARKVTDESEN